MALRRMVYYQPIGYYGYPAAAPRRRKRKRRRRAYRTQYYGADMDLRGAYKGAKSVYSMLRPAPAQRLKAAQAKLKREEDRVKAEQIERQVKAIKEQHKVKSIYAKQGLFSKILRR